MKKSAFIRKIVTEYIGRQKWAEYDRIMEGPPRIDSFTFREFPGGFSWCRSGYEDDPDSWSSLYPTMQAARDGQQECAFNAYALTGFKRNNYPPPLPECFIQGAVKGET